MIYGMTKPIRGKNGENKLKLINVSENTETLRSIQFDYKYG